MGMLSSIRGAAASAMGVQAVRPSATRGAGSAQASSAPSASRDVGVVVNISNAGIEASRLRSSVPQVGRVTPPGTSRQVPQVRPRLMRLPTSYTLEDNGPISGNEIVIDRLRPRTRQSLSSALGGQDSAGERFRRKAFSVDRPIRTGPEIERAADRARTSDTLSARLQQGVVVLGQWNSGSYSSMRADRPGKDTTDHAARMRSMSNLGPRLAKGEESLEVSPGRHIVRPDGQSSAS